MKNILTLIALSLLALPNANAQLFNVVAANDDSLFVLDGTANVIEKIGITETNSNPIQGYTGMAVNPTNSTIYVVVKGSPRYLATLDEAANTITKIADLSDNISGIAFNTQGILYGITGDGAATPKNLYMINTSTGMMIQQADLSGVQDDDGESIGFNSTDNSFYRLAGGGFLYKVTQGTFDQTLVSDTLTNGGISGHALYFDGTNFISMTNEMCTMSSTGIQTNCNLLNEDFKGIVPRTIVGLTTVDKATFAIYPNPTTTHMIIERSQSSVNTFQITDTSGKVLKEGTMEEQTTDLDLTFLSSGMYFVQVGKEKKKLVIQ